MTIETYGNYMLMYCDTCATFTRIYHCKDFDILLTDWRDNGWSLEKAGEHWVHTCRSCRVARAQQGRLF
jgi:hypothetical protein